MSAHFENNPPNPRIFLWIRMFIFCYAAMQTIDMCGAEGISPEASAPYHLVFEEIGQMASSLAYVHTSIKISLPVLDTNINKVAEKIAEAITKFGNVPIQGDDQASLTARRKMINSLQVHLYDLKAEKDRLKNIRSLLPTPPKSQEVGTMRTKRAERYPKQTIASFPEQLFPSLRQTRSVPLQLFFGALGTFIGLFPDARITKLQTALSSTIAAQQKLIRVVNSQATTISRIEKSINELKSNLLATVVFNPAEMNNVLRSTIDQIRRDISQVFNVLQIAQLRRLALEFLSSDQIQELYDTLVRHAKQTDTELLIRNPTDVFQVEMSYFFDGSDITLLLHIPLVPVHSMMRLIKLHAFPLPISEHYSLIPDISTEILALSSHSERYSTQFPATDLLGCHQINTVRLCENKGVLKLEIAETCIGALINQNFTAAKQLCEMKVIPSGETVYRLSGNKHLIYSPRGQTVLVTCQGKTADRAIPKGVTVFHLEEGCHTKLGK
ncbi:MAG: hypothetical protein ACOYB0_10750, partial [Polynucleobacter sp.]